MEASAPWKRLSIRVRSAGVIAAACLLLAIGVFQAATGPLSHTAQPLAALPATTSPAMVELPPLRGAYPAPPIPLISLAGTQTPSVSADRGPAEKAATAPPVELTEIAELGAASPGSAEVLLGFVNRRVREAWQANGVEPSGRADDAEWLRRVYLDLVGHIPPVDVIEKFLADQSASKRSVLVDRLLDDPDFVRNWSTIWTNLLIGQMTPAGVNRSALQAFLRQSFNRNRPWNEVVSDLIAAEGRADENGAVNFLLAHLNEDAIPATAITSRLFLGRQVQCTQCHDHPSNGWKQQQFWELNSFFQQASVVRSEKFDPATGQMRKGIVELAMRDFEGPVYFETRTNLMKVAFPRFGTASVDPGRATNRRRELAKLLTQGDQPMVAEALVNRLWGHFFGQSFTRQADDMGPHNPPSHPDVLTRLTNEFVRSGYDQKQLMRWICQTEAYQLTSQYNESNTVDDPAAGEVPLFSHMYVKPMTAEQLYDSLLIVSQGDVSGRVRWEQSEQQRQEWLQQFVTTFDTEENNEESTFKGSIPQSLMMMNGELVDRAVSIAPGSYLAKILSEKGSETEKITKLSLAALSRPPTVKEIASIKKLLRSSPAHRAPRDRQRQVAVHSEGLQDVYWAFLNSSEFILNH
jgi:hypothetical protein